MKITQATDYAFRLVLFLAENQGETIEAKYIAESENIPGRFLHKIGRLLQKAGIIKSYRGKNGGYMLAGRPGDVALKDIIVAIEGDIFVNKCQYDPDACNRNATENCVIHRALNSICGVLAEELDKYDYQRLIEESNN